MGEVVSGISCVVKKIGGDVVVNGRARTSRDVERLKRIMNEMLEEVYEGKRHRPAGSRRS